MKSILEKYAAIADEKQRERDQAIHDHQQALDALTEKLETAQIRQTKAVTDGNEETFKIEAAIIRDLSDAVNLHNAWLDREPEKPLIKADLYNEGCIAIKKSLSEADSKTGEKILVHLCAILDLCDEAGSRIKNANKFLHRWQHEVFRNDASVDVGNGSRLHLLHLEMQYKDYTLPELAERIRGDSIYRKLSGVSIPAPEIVYHEEVTAEETDTEVY